MNILVVDDSRSARYALRLQLQKYNVNVDTADTAEAGLAMLDGNKPDAIFMDHMMPGMSGFEALQAIKTNPQTAHIPVVMCTSNDDPAYQRDALAKGAMAILPKAMASEKLPRVLQDLNEMLTPRQAEPAAVSARPSPAGAERDAALRALESSLHAFVADELKALRASLRSEIESVRNALPEPDINQVHQAVRKLEHDVLPHLVQQGVHAESKRALDALEKQIDRALADKFDALVEGLPSDKRVVGPIMEAAEALVETKAMEVARRQAQVAGEAAGEERADRVGKILTRSTEQTLKRAYIAAVGSGLVGVGTAVVVYLLLR